MTDERRQMLWHSNAPHAPTGYGNQTALFTPLLNEHFKVAISGYYGTEGNILPWNGMPVLPALGQSLGNETILNHAESWFEGHELRGGLVVTLMDVWPLESQIWRLLNLACWCPVDMEPLAVPVERFLKESGAIPIAMSRFGEQMMLDAGLEPLYVPHGIDTNRYMPRDAAARKQAKERLEFGDRFAVGMVAANKTRMPDRKCYPEALQAFKIFHDSHPDSVLYLHTEADGKFGGTNLPELANRIGLDQEAVRFPDQYRAVHFPYPAEEMADRYAAMDVLLAPSMGEGFGIPVVEAQACGTPVIVTDFSSQPELCGSGWTVEPITRLYTTLSSWQVLPNVEDIVEALRRSYGLSTAESERHRAEARNFAVRYDHRHVFKEYMLPAISEAFARTEKPKVEPRPSETREKVAA